MSKILRRPMFRKGGSISSDGVGITSGLHDMRSKYEDPIDAPVGSFADRFKQAMEQTNANEDAKWNALKSDKSYDLMDLFKSNPDQQPTTTTINPHYRYQEQTYIPVTTASQTGTTRSGGVREPSFEPLEPYEFADKIGATKGASNKDTSKILAATSDLYKDYYNNAIKYREADPVKLGLLAKIDNQKKGENSSSLTTNLKPTPTGTSGLDKYDVGALYEKYLGSVNRPNQDLYDRLKYMELAKFGLGLLTPAKAGESNKLLPAIGRAGVPAVTGLETIAEMQNKEDLGNRDLALKMAIAQSQEAKYREESNRWLIQQRQQQIDTTSSNLGKTFDPKSYPTDEIAKKFIELRDDKRLPITTKDLQPLPKNYDTMSLQDKVKYKDYILVDPLGHFWTLQSGTFKRI
jgi:hypothetical protein